MGLSPRDVNDMSLWEFNACLEGWKAAHASDDAAPAMSDDKAAQLGIEGF
jgi:hypothetical protein